LLAFQEGEKQKIELTGIQLHKVEIGQTTQFKAVIQKFIRRSFALADSDEDKQEIRRTANGPQLVGEDRKATADERKHRDVIRRRCEVDSDLEMPR
jgi:hypothetical protein